MLKVPTNEEMQVSVCKRYEELVLQISAVEEQLVKLRGNASQLFDDMVRLSNRYQDEMRRARINAALREHEDESKERNKTGRRNGAHWNRVTEQAEVERLRNVPSVYAPACATNQETVDSGDRATGERKDHGDARSDQEPVRPS